MISQAARWPALANGVAVLARAIGLTPLISAGGIEYVGLDKLLGVTTPAAKANEYLLNELEGGRVGNLLSGMAWEIVKRRDSWTAARFIV